MEKLVMCMELCAWSYVHGVMCMEKLVMCMEKLFNVHGKASYVHGKASYVHVPKGCCKWRTIETNPCTLCQMFAASNLQTLPSTCALVSQPIHSRSTRSYKLYKLGCHLLGNTCFLSSCEQVHSFELETITNALYLKCSTLLIA